MPLWAGIDEAGYGPKLGPLVVAGAAFHLDGRPAEGVLWERLRDAVCRNLSGSDGRVVVNDSKQVYTPSRGLKALEEGVLSFLRAALDHRGERADHLLELLTGGRGDSGPEAPWCAPARSLPLPLESNPSAVASKADLLRRALNSNGTRLAAVRAAVVQPAEFNQVVSYTHNKSLLLFQKCGLLLRELWDTAGAGESHVVVDRHGGRIHYRRLLRDVWSDCGCDVVAEKPKHSTYRVRDGDRTLTVTFLEGADERVMPAALASMMAKYVREIYMHAFNRFWAERVDGLRPTAGYGRDAGRFLKDIEPVLQSGEWDLKALVRGR
ncbi:MAG: hypothetical protein R6X33_04815 [Candidatus Brocadiia bacterium]